ERAPQSVVIAVGLWQIAPQRLAEGALGIAQRDAILRALGPRDARYDLAEIQLDEIGVRGLLGVLVVPHALLARVGFDQLYALGGTSGELQIAQCLRVNREDRASGSELGRHVADCGPVGDRQAAQASPVE